MEEERHTNEAFDIWIGNFSKLEEEEKDKIYTDIYRYIPILQKKKLITLLNLVEKWRRYLKTISAAAVAACVFELSILYYLLVHNLISDGREIDIFINLIIFKNKINTYYVNIILNK